MKKIDFLNDLKSGKIIFETNKHIISIKPLIKHYEMKTKYAYLDPNEPDTLKSFEDGFLLLGCMDLRCEKCGMRVYNLFLKDNILKPVYTKFKNPEDEEDFTEIKEDINECFVNDDFKSLDSEVNLNGNITFVNFFDNIEEPTSVKYDINNIVGRKNLMNWYSEKNIVYAQTGNTSFDIYISKDRKNIRMYNKIPKDLIKDFELIGNGISCEVWSYMAADKETIEKYNLETDNYNTPVKINDIPAGKWELKHYFDVKRMKGESEPNLFGEFIFIEE